MESFLMLGSAYKTSFTSSFPIFSFFLFVVLAFFLNKLKFLA